MVREVEGRENGMREVGMEGDGGGGGVEKNGDPKMVRWVGGGGVKKNLIS